MDRVQEFQPYVGYPSRTGSQRELESLHETRNLSIIIHRFQSDIGYHESKNPVWIGTDRKSIQERNHARTIPL